MLSLLWSSLIFSFLLVSFSFFLCPLFFFVLFFFFFKQKTAYEMRISDWSSDVCSSDLVLPIGDRRQRMGDARRRMAGRVDHHIGRRMRDQRLRVLTDPGGPTIDRFADGPCRDALRRPADKIGRASCRERVCQYVKISVAAGSLKKKLYNNSKNTY